MATDFNVSIYSVGHPWTGGGQGQVNVTYNPNAKVSHLGYSFTVKFDPKGAVPHNTEIWGCSFKVSVTDPTTYTFTNPTWGNINMQPGAMSTFYFNYTGKVPFLLTNLSTNAIINNLPPLSSPSPGPSGASGVSGPAPGPSGSFPSGPTGRASGVVGSNKIVLGYYPEWGVYGRAFQVENIDATKLTHIHYAFVCANPSPADYAVWKANWGFPVLPYDPTIPEGTVTPIDVSSFGINMPKLQALKQSHPNLHVAIAIGGWSASYNLAKVFADPVLRGRFVTSAVDMVLKWGLDGIDVDFEFPGKPGLFNLGGTNTAGPNDAANMLLMMQQLRKEMDTRSPSKRLTISVAIGCDPDVIPRFTQSISLIDYALLMTYDYAGSGWSPGGLHCALYQDPLQPNPPIGWYGDYAVKLSQAQGWPSSKLLLGVAAYARSWKRLLPVPAGVPFIFGADSGDGPPPSYSPQDQEAGYTSWRDMLPAMAPGNPNGLIRAYDAIAQCGYAYNPTTGAAFSFDDEVSVKAKGIYVNQNNLGGVGMWDLSDDTRDGNATTNLMTVAFTTLGNNNPGPVPTPTPVPIPPAPVPIPPVPVPPAPTGMRLNLLNAGTTTATLPAGASTSLAQNSQVLLSNTGTAAFSVGPGLQYAFS